MLHKLGPFDGSIAVQIDLGKQLTYRIDQCFASLLSGLCRAGVFVIFIICLRVFEYCRCEVLQ